MVHAREPGQRLVIVEGDEAAADAVVTELASRGLAIVTGWSTPGPADGVRVGVVASAADAEAALLAAIRGAGVVVVARATPEIMDALHDDLRHIGPVEVWSGAGSRAPGLSPEARAILSLLAEGCSLGEAAATLGIPRRTADRRLAGARRALGVERTTEAVARAFRLGLLRGRSGPG